MPKSKKFLKLIRATKKHYVGKKVPKRFRKKYGLRYDKKEAESIAYAIAKKSGWRI